MTEVRKPFWVKCEPCNHCWAPAYAPMELALLAKVIKGARCPKCGSDKGFVAKQNNGILNETGCTS
jgi:Zn finger protein HypA/HybF involved in hydrogenase expression